MLVCQPESFHMQHQLLPLFLSRFSESVLTCIHRNPAVRDEFVNSGTEVYVVFSFSRCVD